MMHSTHRVMPFPRRYTWMYVWIKAWGFEVTICWHRMVINKVIKKWLFYIENHFLFCYDNDKYCEVTSISYFVTKIIILSSCFWCIICELNRSAISKLWPVIFTFRILLISLSSSSTRTDLINVWCENSYLYRGFKLLKQEQI